MAKKVITGKCRASNVHLFEPHSINGSDPEYSVTLIIPKNDETTIEHIETGISEAMKDGMHMWNDTVPPSLLLPLHDGDKESSTDSDYVDSYIVNATSVERPRIVDSNLACVANPARVYSGCYIRASLYFYPFIDNSGSGIEVRLCNVQLLDDGKRIREPVFNNIPKEGTNDEVV